MTHGSLFSGIGGIDLGFEWAGIETKWQVEIDPYCRELLSKRFPNAKQFEDVKTVGKHNLEKVDIVSGGFPCQDISIAGRGKGLEGERSGLWTELHRVISELRPRFAFIENVPMLTIRGGVRVIADLAEIGMHAEWQIVGADDVGAWHRRKRIWIVAYSQGRGTGGVHNQSEKKRPQNSDELLGERGGLSRDVPNTGSERLEGHRGECELGESSEEIKVSRGGNVADTNGSRVKRKGKLSEPTAQEGTCRSGYNGRTGFWSVEPNVGRVAHGIPKRVDRLKGLGNAVVPHIPYIIGKRLKELCQKNQAEKPS